MMRTELASPPHRRVQTVGVVSTLATDFCIILYEFYIKWSVEFEKYKSICFYLRPYILCDLGICKIVYATDALKTFLCDRYADRNYKAMLNWTLRYLLAPTPSRSVEAVGWSTSTTYLHGIPYVIVSILAEDAKHELDEDSLELKKQIAQARWVRFQSYWKLATLFREMRKERQRDPLEIELFAYLQLPSTYNWRHPTENERYRMLRWAEGMDDDRPRGHLYSRSKWLADQTMCDGAASRKRSGFLRTSL